MVLCILQVLQHTDDLSFVAFWSPILTRSFLVSLYTSPLWIFARHFESKSTCTNALCSPLWLFYDFLTHGTSNFDCFVFACCLKWSMGWYWVHGMHGMGWSSEGLWWSNAALLWCRVSTSSFSGVFTRKHSTLCMLLLTQTHGPHPQWHLYTFIIYNIWIIWIYF